MAKTLNERVSEYRRRQKQAGLYEARVWIPDTEIAREAIAEAARKIIETCKNPVDAGIEM